MKVRPRLGSLVARSIGLALSALGVWLVVTAAAATTDASQVAGSLLGVWSAFAGLGLLVARVPPSTRAARRPARLLVLRRGAPQARPALVRVGWLPTIRVRRSPLAPGARPAR